VKIVYFFDKESYDGGSKTYFIVSWRLIMQILRALLIATVITSCLAGCYRMPPDDYMSTVPITNNPACIPQKKANATQPEVDF
jgi:hypothetical protein